MRKRAIRALWECCSCPGFSRANDAVVAVLGRANDREDTMKSLVTKICGEMWFTDASSFAGMGTRQSATWPVGWVAAAVSERTARQHAQRRKAGATRDSSVHLCVCLVHRSRRWRGSSC